MGCLRRLDVAPGLEDGFRGRRPTDQRHKKNEQDRKKNVCVVLHLAKMTSKTNQPEDQDEPRSIDCCNDKRDRIHLQ